MSDIIDITDYSKVEEQAATNTEELAPGQVFEDKLV